MILWHLLFLIHVFLVALVQAAVLLALFLKEVESLKSLLIPVSVAALAQAHVLLALFPKNKHKNIH